MRAKQRIGLFFGSFNPIHIGHLAIANYMLEFTDLDKIWLVVSPQNPHKDKKGLLAEHHRLQMVHLALEDDYKIRPCDIEFRMPKPSYTIDTLTRLTEKYPENEFVIIMGGDNLTNLKKWKNYEALIKYYSIYVYQRPGSAKPNVLDAKISYFDAPAMEISSSFIRNAIQSGKNIPYYLPQKVWDYIVEMHFYKK